MGKAGLNIDLSKFASVSGPYRLLCFFLSFSLSCSLSVSCLYRMCNAPREKQRCYLDTTCRGPIFRFLNVSLNSFCRSDWRVCFSFSFLSLSFSLFLSFSLSFSISFCSSLRVSLRVFLCLSVYFLSDRNRFRMPVSAIKVAFNLLFVQTVLISLSERNNKKTNK